ncbi:MAG: MopE-related protein, partial [Desulfobacteraceae bacterium]|nr:MopE-related protein [Desulfobacteraceae bacterium]
MELVIKGFGRHHVLGLLTMLCSLMLVTVGCGGGGGGGEAGAGGPALATGVFVDSPVEGMDYETGSESGLTGLSGRFNYREGEIITFSIGDVILGQAAGKYMLTPIDLVPGAADETDSTVTNICRLLQSLDQDGNLQNGIQITAQIRDEVDGRAIDFNLSISQFENDPAIEGLFDTLNALNLFTADTPRQIISAAVAQNHLRATLNSPDTDGDGYTEGQGDCNDDNAAIHPDAVDICGDGIDQDCSGADLTCSTGNSAYETQLLELISAYRTSNALSPLGFDALLNSLAAEHSEYMHANNSLNHDGFNDRAARSGFSYCVENVGW